MQLRKFQKMMHHNIHAAGMFLRLILLKQSPFKTHYSIENFLCFVCQGNFSLWAIIWKTNKQKENTMYFMPSNVRTSLTKYHISAQLPI